MIPWKRIIKKQDWLEYASEFFEILVTDGKEVYAVWIEDGVLRFHPDLSNIEDIESGLTHWVEVLALQMPNKNIANVNSKKELLYIDEMRK